jgi:hypothetical protein
MMRHLLIAASLLITACSRESPPDLERYLMTIREAGMSEGAQQALRSVAVVRIGQTLLSFEKDSTTGQYARVYHSASCPVRGATAEQLKAWREGLDKAATKEVERLRSLADFDSSGFITTEEGLKFRRLAETGLEAAYICRHDVCTQEALSTAIGLPPASLRELLGEYKDLQERAAARKIDGFPPVPV